MTLGARNVLQGTIQKLIRGPVMAEVILPLPGGSTISAIITNESAEALGLKEGSDPVAIFKASKRASTGLADRAIGSRWGAPGGQSESA